MIIVLNGILKKSRMFPYSYQGKFFSDSYFAPLKLMHLIKN